MRDTVLFFAVFLLGCGIVGLAGLAVLWIWREPEPSPPFPAGHFAARMSTLVPLSTLFREDTIPFIQPSKKVLRRTSRPHPYNWKTREPMIWGRS